MAAVFWFGIIAAIGGTWVIFVRNRLVRLRVLAEESWHDIDTQLKRRWDLIPGLVEVAKGYAVHEAAVFERITEARSRALAASGPQDQATAEDGLKNALFSLFALAEDYPDLLANETFLGIQASLVEAENALQKARRYYNAVVRELNTAVMSFPRNILAAVFRVRPREYFMLLEEQVREALKLEMR